MIEYTLTIGEDLAVVLFEFFSRLEETDRLEIAHPAERVALRMLSAQIDKTTPTMFDPDYDSILEDARRRLAGALPFPE